MARQRHNPFAALIKRLPHKALLRREAPLRPADSDEVKAVMLGIASDAESLCYAGSRGAEIECKVFCFDTEEKARAMQAWIDASDIASRPRPQPPPNYPQLKCG